MAGRPQTRPHLRSLRWLGCRVGHDCAAHTAARQPQYAARSTIASGSRRCARVSSLSGDGGNDNLLAATPGPVTVLGGAGDDRVDGSGAGIGQERIALGDGNDRYLPRSTPSSAPETTPSMVGPDRTP
jgi:hypothetical protein